MISPRCRLCGAHLETTVIDLGNQPLANRYLEPFEIDSERAFPLHARLCESCGLVQVDDVVPPDQIFGEYAYFSSYSESWTDHARSYATATTKKLSLTQDDLVVEVASNDGYLLKWFLGLGLNVLGIEPAANVARTALLDGVPTSIEFFGLDTATRIRAEYGPARLIVANNVLAHVPDLNDFISGIRLLLADDGFVSIEVPHLLNLVDFVQFDTIYHEHYSYFSLSTMIKAFERHGIQVIDAERLSTHGGSLRVWLAHYSSKSSRSANNSVRSILNSEFEARLQLSSGYVEFSRRVIECRDGFVDFLASACERGQTVAAYGAAAKGNTLLNFADVGISQIPYVVDRNPHKQGKLLPGTHIPVLDPRVIPETKPDYLLVLPWNLRQEVSRQMRLIREWNGQFVTAVPTIELW